MKTNNILCKVDFKKLNASITDFLLYGPDASTPSINVLLDSRGLYVANLSSKFTQKKKHQIEILYSNQGIENKKQTWF
jgi:hypothetical protein